VYREIELLRGRPLLVYTTKYPGAPPKAPISITVEDVDGFTDLLGCVQGSEEVDVLIHSPGGSPEATERIVGLLRTTFKKVYFLVPHSAYSAATMLALSGNEIVLHPSATLGPIDPQVNGVPARSTQRGFNKVRDILREQGPEAIPAYAPLIEKLTLELLEICEDSLSLSKELAREWLTNYMFAGDESAAEKIETAIEFFSNYDQHKTHSRPFTFAKLEHLKLKIRLAEPALEQLLREAHILLMGYLSVTPFVKLYECAGGISWGTQFLSGPMVQPPGAPESTIGE